ncbi:MAG TPA: phosphohydrolase [Myxococcales bacterium]|nr:phosphohydrolase [Myxococcales bacterium]
MPNWRASFTNNLVGNLVSGFEERRLDALFISGGIDTRVKSSLSQQLHFLLEVDRLKSVERQNHCVHAKRRENSAEHSWHLALFALVLDLPTSVDRYRVIQMLLLHDLVEIDAGDTFAYDEEGHGDKLARETAAAERLFGLLPQAQGASLLEIWKEFEAQDSPEARAAAAIDRFQPILLNRYSDDPSWARHGIRRDQVLTRNGIIEHEFPELWSRLLQLTEEAVAMGILLP